MKAFLKRAGKALGFTVMLLLAVGLVYALAALLVNLLLLFWAALASQYGEEITAVAIGLAVVAVGVFAIAFFVQPWGRDEE